MPQVSREPLTAAEAGNLPMNVKSPTLRHGQVMWLLSELGYGLGADKGALLEYLKALRKLGIPFGRAKFQSGRSRRLARYSYCHLMELVIVMSLRVYHVIPDSVLQQIIRYRPKLSRIYIHAYEFRRSGPGAPFILRCPNGPSIELRGMYLDLDIRFSAGRLSHFRPPRLLTPCEALEIFSKASSPGRVFLPMNLSILAEQVTALASAVPRLRSTPSVRRQRAPS
jgi:hypothetical protein